MAEAEKKEEAGEEAVAPKKNKKKLFMLIGIGVLVLALVGGGAFFMMHKKAGAEGENGDAAAEEAHDEKAHPPAYVKLEAFTTNLATEDNQATDTAAQYIQVVVELKVEDEKVGEELKSYMPEIRNNILRLLSSKKPSQLATSEGKDVLAKEILGSVNGVVSPESKKSDKAHGPVGAVLFSSFIIQ